MDEVDVHDVARAREVLAEGEVDPLTRTRGGTVERECELGFRRRRDNECNQRSENGDQVTDARHALTLTRFSAGYCRGRAEVRPVGLHGRRKRARTVQVEPTLNCKWV